MGALSWWAEEARHAWSARDAASHASLVEKWAAQPPATGQSAGFKPPRGTEKTFPILLPLQVWRCDDCAEPATAVRGSMTLRLDAVSLVRLMSSPRPAFVLASTPGCTQCDGALGGAWEQLATLTRDQLREPGAVWRLECNEQPMLCDVLPAVAAATPGDPLFMEWHHGDMVPKKSRSGRQPHS